MYLTVCRLFTEFIFLLLLQACGITAVSLANAATTSDGLCDSVSSSPSDIAIVNGGRKLYVTDSAAKRVVILSPVSRELQNTLLIPGEAYAILPSPDGTRAYVLSRVSAGAMLVTVDTRTDKVINTLILDPPPVSSIDISRDGRTLYIARPQSEYVSRIDVTGNSHAQAGPISTGATGLTRGRLAIARAHIYSLSSGELKVVDSTDGSFVKRLPLSETEEYFLSISPDESLLALTRWSFDVNKLDSVSFIRTGDNAEAGSVLIDGDPVSSIFSRDGRTLYASVSYEKFVRKGKNELLTELQMPAIVAIDTSSAKVVATIPLNAWPGRGVIAPDNKRIYYITSTPARDKTLSSKRRGVTIIDTRTNRVIGEISLPSSRASKDGCS